MRKLTLLFLFCLIPSLLFAQGIQPVGGITVAAAAAASPEVYNETFDGAESGTDCTGSFDNSGWTCVVTNSTVITADSTTQKVSGANSLGLLIDAAADNAYAYTSVTSQTGAVYIRFKFFATGTWDPIFQNVNIFGALQPATSPPTSDVFYFYIRYDSSYIDLFVTDAQSGLNDSTTGADIAPNQWHTVIYYHPSDGVNSPQWKLDGGEAVSLTHATKSNRDIGKIMVGENAASSGTYIYIEDVAICTTAAACGW